MKIVFLTASTSRAAGGLYFTITELTKSLLAKGMDVTVVGLDDEYSADDRAGFGDVPVIPYRRVDLPILRTFGYSTNLMSLLEEIKPDIIHLQGLWMYHSWAALKYKKRYPDTKVVVEPHGMLDPWALDNSSWKKKAVGHLFEYENLKTADCIHALCKSEEDSIRAFGLSNRIEIIPNGINIVKCHERNKSNIIQYIGRIHPKKGLDVLIEAVRLISQSNRSLLSNWIVRIAGWDQNGYQCELEQKVSKYGLENFIQFSGPRFGQEKELDLVKSKAFILPSFSEGLPMSILEAWSYGLPVLMTEFCNLPEGFNADAALKIEPTPMSVASGLMEIMLAGEERINVMGDNARRLVADSFSWDKIADKTIDLYKSL